MPAPVPGITISDIDILARTLWSEARGEGIRGMEAVAEVVLNRWQDPRRWPESIAEVCLETSQFSGWNSNDRNRALLQRLGFHDENFRRAFAIASLACDGRLEHRTGGANHFYSIDLPRAPSWADETRHTVTIGKHRFFRL